MMTYVLQNAEGQIETTQSISAGLDYPAGTRALLPDEPGAHKVRYTNRLGGR